MTETELWRRVFGDTPDEIARYSAALSLNDHRFSVWEHGELCAAAYWYDCGSLVFPDKAEHPAAVLYAVAAVPEKRGKGYGQQVVRLAWSDMQKNGRLPLTVPAEKPLFDYYRKTVGAESFFSVCRKMLSDGQKGAYSVIRAPEYGALRETLLADRPHIRFSLPCLQLQETRCRFFAVSGGCFALEKRQGMLTAVEALGEVSAVEAALRTLSGGVPVQMLFPSPGREEGCPFAMSAPLSQAPDKEPWFGFAFD